ncbi:MAG TPA: adenylate/guanylate cyclase domain-containing protein [Vicinamibacteria bacterium]|nr:adenylate/guanylate cyclase domain-containing protein [Vicinamibacteria bacterium]
MSRFQPTLGQVFALTIVGLGALLGVLLWVFAASSRRTIVDSSEELRALQTEVTRLRIENYLGQADQAVTHVENQIRYGACKAEDALSVEAHLFAELLNTPDLAEVAFTHAIRRGYLDDGGPDLAPEGRWQVSVYRETASEASPIHTRFDFRERGRLVSDLRQRAPHGSLLAAGLVRGKKEPPDPTAHLTFVTPASRDFEDGDAIWSDLSHSQLDELLPEDQRRVVVTVLKAIKDPAGRFVGVVRVAIPEKRLDSLVAPKAGDRHRAFLCDDQGRLITRVNEGDRLKDLDGDLRIVSDRLPGQIAVAMGHPALHEVRPDDLDASGRFDLAGRPFLVSFRGLPRTLGWRVGVVVAEDALPGVEKLVAQRRQLFISALGVIVLILLGGALTLRSVRAGLKRIVDQTARMRRFDFARNEPAAPFRDVAEVMDSVEQAKTAMRAMSKYVPVGLVRQLYESKREPVLGGELMPLTVLFTDIEDFTSHSERLSPNALAEALGAYLEAMTSAIHATGGTIDKYIGDAVMAVWNAPTPCADHALRACRAALDCGAALERLYGDGWGERPRFVTRFGIHSAEVMVGHFGAPDRMSYTAMGDGVNLASRLEGLNKQYGTTILVSEAVHAAAKDAFAFRRLDRVAVKGRTEGILVYELLGDARAAAARIRLAHGYESALEHYFERRFAEAIALLESQAVEDAPSAALLARCREFHASPPPAEWGGVHVSRVK